MKKLKRITEITVKTADSIKGGKNCSCSCSCSCAQTDTSAATKDGEKSATTLNTFVGH